MNSCRSIVKFVGIHRANSSVKAATVPKGGWLLCWKYDFQIQRLVRNFL